MKSTLLAVGAGAVGVAMLVRRRQRLAMPASKRTDSAPPGDAPPEPHPATAIDEVDALARVMTSEADRYTEPERTAIAWSVRNRARKRRTSIANLVCSPSCGPCCQGRPFSSARPATAINRQLAANVLAAPLADDPTYGATSFFEPRVQDLLVAAGRPGYRFTSDQLRERWRKDGQGSRISVGAFEFWA